MPTHRFRPEPLPPDRPREGAQELRKYLAQTGADREAGQDVVSIPVPHIDIPHFVHDTGRAGRRPGRRTRREEGGGKAGDQPGQHLLEVDVTLEELAAILGEELELPRIQPKGKSRSSRRQGGTPASDDRPRVAAPLPAHLPRRRSGADRDRHLRPRRTRSSSPIRDDKRYRSWKPRRSRSRQRRHHLHDGRVRLDGRRAEGDRPHRELLDRHVAAPPVQGPREPLHHPRRRRARGRSRHLLPHARVGRHDDLVRLQALRADHRRATTRPTSGTSTRSTSPTATTGPSTTRARASSCSRTKLLPGVNLFAYGQVESPYGSGQFIKDLREHFGEDERVVTSRDPRQGRDRGLDQGRSSGRGRSDDADATLSRRPRATRRSEIEELRARATGSTSSPSSSRCSTTSR